jgi:hypothetical protein
MVIFAPSTIIESYHLFSQFRLHLVDLSGSSCCVDGRGSELSDGRIFKDANWFVYSVNMCIYKFLFELVA